VSHPVHVTTMIDSLTCRWEKVLSQKDVDEIYTYIRDNLPAVNTRATSHNGIGARTLRAGLVECGWTQEALSKTTRLIDSITKYQYEPNPPDNDNRLSKKRGPDVSCDDITGNISKRHCFFGLGDSDQFSTPLLRISDNLPANLETDPNQPATDEFLRHFLSMSGDLPDTSQTDPSWLATDEILTHYLSTAGDLPDTSPQTDPSQLGTDEFLTHYLSTAGDLPDTLQTDPSWLATDEFLTHYLSTAGDLPDTLQQADSTQVTSSTLGSHGTMISPSML